MIVSRAKAEEAAFIFGFDLSCHMTEQHITAMYRTLAKKHHPDAGGNAEAFARVDWAKHVLLAWLEKPGSGQPTSQPELCTSCDGAGFIRRQRGFGKGVRLQCDKCHGSGDANYERDRGGDHQ